jgi:tRNA (guanine-N7-)-methyltransferase
MRLRNVKYAKELILQNPQIVIPNPHDYKSNWSKLFGNKHPIEVEIGCGKGKFIYESALNNPNINFIGIEKFDSVIVRALEKVIEHPLDNLKLLRLDAEHIADVFSKNEVDKIYLNFSDPWPKIRQAKRRLTSTRFLNRYSNILSKNAEIRLKTDNFSLYEFSMMSLNEHVQFTIETLNLNLYKDLSEHNIQTEFEVKFVEMGNTIFYLKAKYIGE